MPGEAHFCSAHHPRKHFNFDALEIGIKKTRNESPTTVTVFTDSQTAIAKILEPKVRSGAGVVRDLIYRNAHMIKNSWYYDGFSVIQKY